MFFSTILAIKYNLTLFLVSKYPFFVDINHALVESNLDLLFECMAKLDCLKVSKLLIKSEQVSLL